MSGPDRAGGGTRGGPDPAGQPAPGGGSGTVLLRLGGLSGFLGVAAGAFGAHALRGRLQPDLLQVFDTAARYQLIHAVALVASALLLDRRSSATARAAGWLFAVGTLLFSGSLYGLALSGWRALGAITPLGGLCFLAGWLALAASSLGRRAA